MRTHAQGLTEEQALLAHPNLDIYTSSFRAMRNTLSGSPLRSLMKMIVDADSRVVLGAHMVGDHAAEIMQVGGQECCDVWNSEFRKMVGVLVSGTVYFKKWLVLCGTVYLKNGCCDAWYSV